MSQLPMPQMLITAFREAADNENDIYENAEIKGLMDVFRAGQFVTTVEAIQSGLSFLNLAAGDSLSLQDFMALWQTLFLWQENPDEQADFEKMEERQATGEFPFILPKTEEEKDLLLLGTPGEAAQIDSFVAQHLEEFMRSQSSVSDRLPEKYLQARWYQSNCYNVIQMYHLNNSKRADFCAPLH